MFLLLNIVLQVLAQDISQEKEIIRGTQIGKQQIKPPQFANDIISYTENPKESPKPVRHNK